MSDSYNTLERAIARVLARAPFIKQIIKRCYSQLVYIRSRKNHQFMADFEVVSVTGDETKESFFGYFDKSPMIANGFTLVHSTGLKTDCLPQVDRKVTIEVYDASGNRHLTVETNTYNWQQGSRAHWLDDEHFIFNDVDTDNQIYVSRVYSVISKQEVKRFQLPVQDSFKSDYFLALNYRRLMAMRPDYGYRNLPALNESELQDISIDGIWKVSIETGESELLLSIADVQSVNKEDDFDGSTHKINHVSISPSGDRFIFLHRYFIGQRRVDRLMVSTLDGKDVKPLAAHGMVSHCFWADESTVLGYMRGPNNKDAYWLIDIESGSFEHFANGALDKYGDGHPHVVGDWFITDTYPDKARMQYLKLCNWKTGEIKNLGEFFHGFNYSGETRCDLHPRMSSDGQYVLFDSVFSGKRQLYRMDLNKRTSVN